MSNLPKLWSESPFKGPFRDISRFQERMDRLMSEFMDLRGQMESTGSDFFPSSEMSEDEKNYNLKVDLPGVKKEDVKIEVDGDHLTVQAERKSEKEEKTKRKYFSEISYGSYLRTFTLPQPIDEKKVDAKYDNGILHITVAKAPENKAKQISIH